MTALSGPGVRRHADRGGQVRTSLTAVDRATSERIDVLVELEPCDRVCSLEAALARLLPPAPDGLWLDGRPLDPAATVEASGVRAGSVLVRGGPLPEQATARAALHVVSGPDAGTIVPLPEGDTVVGRDQLPASGVGRRALGLHHGPAGVVATDLGGTPAVLRSGQPLDAPLAVGAADLLEVGSDLVAVVAVGAPAADVTAGPELAVDVNRQPRLRPATSVRALERPAVPSAPEPRRLPVLALLLPVVLGVVMALVSSPLFLLFTLMSPLLALSTWSTDRSAGRRTHARATAAHQAALAEVEQELTALVAAETRARREACPDAAQVLLTAAGPGCRLWERRRSEDDSLLLRIGSGDVTATSVRVTPAPPPLLREVPVTVPLREAGVLGIAGPTAASRALARWLVGQCAVLHSPRDLAVWLLVDPDHGPSEADWGWLRWLPHAQPGAAQEGAALVGTTHDGLALRVAELTSLVAGRLAVVQDVRAQLTARSEPDVLVVLDGARALRSLGGMAGVLRDGPGVGVHVLCLDEDERRLPEECQAVVALDGPAHLTVRRTGLTAQPGVRAELVSASWAEQVARALAPLRDAAAEAGSGQVPASARLLDVLGLSEPTAEDVLARWGRTACAVVGLGADGPVSLDLRSDGPHALVAGTTGAGKSEFLQTLVASLAVANRPDAMTFVLVDYKGGAAFKDCARLPHTVGMVTDLDGPLVERALTSLTAELSAREQRLAEVGAKDVEDYWRTVSAVEPLPRLVIVIDEFASLVEELPDFVRGLVGIAQRGRSLGVHLVLATQRPSGVVSPEIRANTNLRVALRVTDTTESLDVLDAPDAAAISRSTPGRALARTGHTSLTAFQVARVGGRAPGAVAPAARPVEAQELPWPRVGTSLPPPRAAETAPDQESTDLHALVEAVRAAADRLGLATPRGPWLPPLAALLTLTDVRREGTDPRPPAEGDRGGAVGRLGPLPPVTYGLEDLPAQQARRPAVLDLEQGGHLLVAGAPRTGRTTLLRTLAASLASTVAPSDAHLFVLDCGNGALQGLAALPHCGAVVTRTEPERADRLLSRLSAEVARRAELLSFGGFADLSEQRAASADPLPYLVLLLDRWEGFTAAFDDLDGGRLTETLLRLLREGPGAGLRVVVTGDRSVLLGKIAAAVEDRLVLRLADRGDYSLAGLQVRHLPDQVPPGRGLRPGSGSQVQVALLTADASGAAEAAALAQVAASAPAGGPGPRPFRVDVLPRLITTAHARALGAAASGVALAVGGDELRLRGIDLAVDGPGFTIAGPPRSGRSTALLALAAFLREAGTPVCLLAPRPSPLRELTGPHVLHLAVSADPDPAALAEVLNGADGPVAVLVDDAELLHTAAIGELLQQVLREGRDRGHAVVVAGTTEDLAASFRGFTVDARKSRSGLLLSPQALLSGELLGLRLPRSASFSGPAGRGLLVRGGQPLLVQVPLPD